ncbi:hypothetical protein AAG747_09335 [Rapidithrix thailandica]|uniref:Uncharacterized protein n=1 Tax=Rapidithrix thailandica TaxID=413964 RepID=A0AAW9S6S2_9BACT
MKEYIGLCFVCFNRSDYLPNSTPLTLKGKKSNVIHLQYKLAQNHDEATEHLEAELVRFRGK